MDVKPLRGRSTGLIFLFVTSSMHIINETIQVFSFSCMKFGITCHNLSFSLHNFMLQIIPFFVLRSKHNLQWSVLYFATHNYRTCNCASYILGRYVIFLVTACSIFCDDQFFFNQDTPLQRLQHMVARRVVLELKWSHIGAAWALHRHCITSQFCDDALKTITYFFTRVVTYVVNTVGNT